MSSARNMVEECPTGFPTLKSQRMISGSGSPRLGSCMTFPSCRMNISLPTIRMFGFDSRNCFCRSRRIGRQKSSASIRAINLPRAAAIPRLAAPTTPKFRSLRMIRSRLSLKPETSRSAQQFQSFYRTINFRRTVTVVITVGEYHIEREIIFCRTQFRAVKSAWLTRRTAKPFSRHGRDMR